VLRRALVLMALFAASGAQAELDARTIIERAHAAAGGAVWARPQTLILSGSATLCQDGVPERCVVADDYRMWRVFPRESSDAHVANGQVRIDAKNADQIVFQTSFDGVNTYNQNGRVPGAQASQEWSENFGFGIIRFALGEGFRLERMNPDAVEGFACETVRVTDPANSQTTFWIDRSNFSIRKVGFQTSRGWHERIYSHFLRLPSGFQQPQRVRLYYAGIKTNDIWWQSATVNEPIDPSVFRIGE
jgi:hypothetical protein